jgi:hypothetical protein
LRRFWARSMRWSLTKRIHQSLHFRPSSALSCRNLGFAAATNLLQSQSCHDFKVLNKCASFMHKYPSENSFGREVTHSMRHQERTGTIKKVKPFPVLVRQTFQRPFERRRRHYIHPGRYARHHNCHSHTTPRNGKAVEISRC